MTEPARPAAQPSLPAAGPSASEAALPSPADDDAASVTHGFLFADLRDYTGYVEARGNRAGAALLERYRALVRDVVAAAHGAEIRTEGDSFYVVFQSVSAAVRAGMAIVRAAAATTEEPNPIRVGVGVHAGETVETTEGFVGSAVNIAARLCAEARAGELVVSETVRGLTRTSLEVTFEPLGARRLKGVPEPVACYRVVPRGAAVHAPATGPVARRAWVVAAGLVAVVAVALAVAGAAALGGGSTAAPTPGPSGVAGPSGAADPSGAAAASGAAPASGAAVAPASTLPSAPTASPAASPSLDPFPTAAEAAIMEALPPDLVSNCRHGGTSDDAFLAGFVGTYRTPESEHFAATDWPVTPRVLAGITCRPPSGADRLYVAEPERPPGFSSAEKGWADEYMSRLTGRWNIRLGSCATEAKAYERWRTPQGTGLIACMNPYQGRPWIYFSFLGGRYLGFATRDDADPDALYAWWEQLKTFLP